MVRPRSPQACIQCRKKFEITSEDERFLQMFDVPNPKSCPDCRLQRRLCERNTRNLYYRKCDLTGKQIISQYNTDQPFPVFSEEAWNGDGWDGLSYGRDFDFSREFSPQFKSLLDAVPHLALFNTPGTMENSDYNNCTGYLKNCYLICESDLCEDSYYSNLQKKCKDTVDCSVCYECERCYECIDCIGCHNVRFSQDSEQCSDSLFLFDCRGLNNCIGCIGQRQKSHMIFNVQYTPDEFEKHKQAMKLNSRQGLKTLEDQCRKFFEDHPHRPLIVEQSESSAGDRIYNCKNAVNCFDVKDIEDCRHCQRLSLNCKSCMDFNSWGQDSELVYQCASCGDRTYNSKFCSTCISVVNAEYSFECFHCRDIFGCVGLKGKQYCVLNKQYSEGEYSNLRGKIVSHMKNTGEFGEFFPMSLCAFAYNESFAPDIFPMTKDEVLARGWRWYEQDEAKGNYMGAQVEVPETVAEANDSLTKKILSCQATGKPYKIIPQELKFYRSMDLPVPEYCPDERHRRRITKRNPYKIWNRSCAKCEKEIETTFSPDRPEIVYCESCFLASVY